MTKEQFEMWKQEMVASREQVAQALSKLVKDVEAHDHEAAVLLRTVARDLEKLRDYLAE